MQFQSVRDLHEAYEELERLLALRQAPAIAMLLRQKFLEAILDADDAIWSGYGFSAAVGLLASVRDPVIRSLPTDQLRRLLDIGERIRSRPAPAGMDGASAWSEKVDRATTLLRSAFGNGPDATLAARPPNGAGNGSARIFIPVVARLVDPRRTHPLYAGTRLGLLARLDVRVELAAGEGMDDPLVIDGDVALATRAAFAEALLIVNRLSAWGAPATHRCSVLLRCSPAEARITGRSGSLGFLLAVATARASHSLGAYHRSIAPGTAATGDLAGTRVLPVDASTLADKIRACSEGGLRRLIVPAQQADEANRLLDAERQQRNECPLEIVPVSDASEFWASGRRPVRRSRRTIKAIASRWHHRLTQSRLRAGMLGSAAAAIASAIILWSVLRSAPPVRADWEGDEIALRNTHGITTRRVDLPYRPMFGWTSEFQPQKTQPLADLNGDGKRELLAIHGSQPDGRDLLSAVDAQGSLVWRRQSDQLTPSSFGQPRDVSWWMIAITPPRAGRVELTAFARSHQHSLTILVRLDPVTGQTLGILRNHGHLETYQPIQRVDSGRQILAISGTENNLGCALAAFVDPSQMRIPEEFNDISDVVVLADSVSLSAGVSAVWSFPVDRFTNASRSACEKIDQLHSGDLHVSVFVILDALSGSVVYEMDAGDLSMPIVLNAYYSDKTKDLIRSLKGPTPEAVFAEEAQRLAREVRCLTPRGWRPARLGPGFSPTDPSAVTSAFMREGP